MTDPSPSAPGLPTEPGRAEAAGRASGAAVPPIDSLPELLAPAGDWDCVRAAVANGADAVYFGLDCGFNARARAANFAPQDLPELIAFLHAHRVRGYVTLNTLVFSDELEAIEPLVRQIAAAGTDAVLVQDFGLARLIRRTAPGLPIHASTQMSLTSAECVAVAQRLGLDRVVVARELSVADIARMRRGSPVPLEVFVHGALCVAYSGQCLTSESLGGRSANRGQCAQACRLPYELVCDGEDVDLGDRRYLLSPQDLAAWSLVPDLIAAGVVSLKIEGRLKTPEYVANIVRHYREALDAAAAGTRFDASPRRIEELELSFSRGFSQGWLPGLDHKALVPATSSAKRGVQVGTVRAVRGARTTIELTGRLKAGDGIVFDGDRAAGDEQGGRVFVLSRAGRPVEGEIDGTEAPVAVDVEFARGALDTSRLHPGQIVWKTDDPALTRRLRRTFSGHVHGRERPVLLDVSARTGAPLRIRAQVSGLAPVDLVGDAPLAPAEKHPLTQDVLAEQFGRLGGTGFVLENLTAEIDGAPHVPLSVLGRLRHELVAALRQAEAASHPEPVPLAPSLVLPELRAAALDRWRPPRDAKSAADSEAPLLPVLCRSLDGLRTLLAHGVRLVYADFQDVREYREAVAEARSCGAVLHLATPRIHKPGETGLFKALAKHEPDGVLVRNLAGLDFCVSHGIACLADFSLNAANELTVDWLLEQGASHVTAAYDLNRDQLLDLVRHAPAERLEVVVHQHMPLFHMEHCVFCAVLSPGTDATNCGRPCDRHEVRLRDRTGAEHPLHADVGCRNTLFNAAAQSGAEVVGALLERGVRRFRLEVLPESGAAEVRRIVDLYRALVEGRTSGRDVWSSLRATNRIGTTRGTLEAQRDPLAIL